MKLNVKTVPKQSIKSIKASISQNHFFARKSPLLLALLAAIAAAPALAEDNTAQTTSTTTEKTAEPSTAVETVIVTSRRREERVQDVPTPITVLSSKTLETQRISKLEDLQQALPSLNVAYQNPRQASVAIRGLGNNPASDGLESSVGVYLDNVYLGRPGMAVFDILDVSQLELLRGPQGTLFGKNTTGGVLNISSKLPSFTPVRTLEVSAGERGYLQTKATLSDAITDDLAGRISLYQTQQDGYITNVSQPGADKLNDTSRQGVRAQLYYKPSEKFNLRWIGDYNTEDDSQGTMVFYGIGPSYRYSDGIVRNRLLDNAAQSGASAILTDPHLKAVTSDSQQNMNVKQGGTSLETNWTLDSGHKLTSITAYRSWDFKPKNGEGVDSPSIQAIGVGVNDSQFSQEIRLASPTGGAFDWVTGLYYFQQGIDNNTHYQYGPTADAFLLYNTALRPLIAKNSAKVLNNITSDTYGSANTKSYSIFGQSTWHANSKLDITAGGRITYEDKDAEVNRLNPIGGATLTSPSLIAARNGQVGAYDSGELTRHDTSYAGLLTASYHLDQNNLGYATYSHGEKSGGFNLAVGSAPTAGAKSLQVEPESVDNFELGLKQNLLDGRLLLNTSLFWANVSNYQTTSLVQVGSTLVSVLANAGKIQSRGVELDATLRPVKGLTLNLNGSWNDVTYLSYENAPTPSEISFPTGINSRSLNGQPVYGAPEWIANANGRYDFQTEGSLHPYVSASYAWRSWSYGTLDNSKQAIIPAYGLINASIGARKVFAKTELDASLWVKNAADKIYFTNTFAWLNGSYVGTIGSPRTIGGTLKLSF